jgi:hypothetical protein
LQVWERPDIDDTQDRQEFVEALSHAASVIWAKCGDNPREAKGFLNMLRFLAASDREEPGDRDATWEPNLVAYAAFGSADRFPGDWAWPTTPAQGARYQQMCLRAGLDPASLEPTTDRRTGLSAAAV